MSNGYLVAADADLEAARLLADGFDLDVIEASSVTDPDTVANALTAASNIGIVISAAAARQASFAALLRSIAQRVGRAQLILAEPDARAPFAFLPNDWPVMSLEDARARAGELLRRRQGEGGEAPRAAPLPQESSPEPAPETSPPEPPIRDRAITIEPRADEDHPDAKQPEDEDSFGAPDLGEAPRDAEQQTPPMTGGVAPDVPTSPGGDAEPPAPPASAAPPQPAPEEQTSDGAGAPAPPRHSAPPPVTRGRVGAALSAEADATAFAPKKLRRGTPELVRIVVHQPKDLHDVIKAARRIDARSDPAPQGMSIGKVELGASIGVSLEVRGAACDGTLQRRTWAGEPIDFSFSVEADADVKQAVILARVFVDDAQIGVLAFTRPVIGERKKPEQVGDRARLKRHKRVFLSYSSKDRETVAAIATAYAAAGVQHFFDRTSLKGGEEWSPRLRREIDRADLFHLCWSKSAASSEWVEKEAEHALTRRRRSSGKRPDITVQMLDGPPWAPHPPHLDSINFDDFVRAAIVGYARGDSES